MKERQTIHFEEWVNFVDEVRFAYLDRDEDGPKVGDMISFSSVCSKLLTQVARFGNVPP